MVRQTGFLTHWGRRLRYIDDVQGLHARIRIGADIDCRPGHRQPAAVAKAPVRHLRIGGVDTSRIRRPPSWTYGRSPGVRNRPCASPHVATLTRGACGFGETTIANPRSKRSSSPRISSDSPSLFEITPPTTCAAGSEHQHLKCGAAGCTVPSGGIHVRIGHGQTPTSCGHSVRAPSRLRGRRGTPERDGSQAGIPDSLYSQPRE
jgi:hypothetical protein